MKRSRTIRYALESLGDVLIKDTEDEPCRPIQQLSFNLVSYEKVWQIPRSSVDLAVHFHPEVSRFI